MGTAAVPVDQRSATAVALCWREARPVVQCVFQLRFAVGLVLALAGAGTFDPVMVGLGSSAWLLTTWAVYLLNGISDVVEDRANASSRPIAAGALPVPVAFATVGFLAVAAMLLGAMVSPLMAALVAAMLGLGWCYSMGARPQKNTTTGFMGVVTAGGMLTYLAGWHVGGAGTMSPTLAVFGVAMAAWMGVAGMTKDLSDVHGDALAGRQSVPVVLGDRRSRLVIAAAAVSLGATFLATALATAPVVVVPAAVVCAGSLVLACVATTGLGRGGQSRRRRPYRAFMVTQYVANLTVLLLFVV